MTGTQKKRHMALDELQRLIDANPAVDWRAIALGDRSAIDALHWHDLDPGAVMPLVKAYQRLVRILPAGEDRRALALIGSGLHSAIQIANLPRDEFARWWAALFPGDEAIGEAVRSNAIARRSALLLNHIDNIQSNEPHYRAARFK